MFFRRVVAKIAVLGVCLSPLGAFSDDLSESNSGLWLLAKYDVNGDQQISVNEIGKKREKMFVHMDHDGDGSVSFAEYKTLDSKRRALILKARFNKLDLDQDGNVDTREYSSYVGSFDRFDHNRDGKITPKEMRKGEQSTVKSNEVVEGTGTHCLLWLCVRSSL